MEKATSKILEWKGAKTEDEAIAKQIAQKLQLGEVYFAYNVPLQIWISYNKEDEPKSGIDLTKSCILNYMPRKETCEMESLDQVFNSDIKVTAKDIKDFMKISALIMKNLAKLMEKFDPLSGEDHNYIYYPNTDN